MSVKVLVFVEQRNGVVHPASLQALTRARELAVESAGTLSVVMLGTGAADAAARVGAFGASRLFEAEAGGEYHPLNFTAAIQSAIEESQADLLVFGTTAMARDLAPRLAVRCDAALATDCTSVEWGPDEVLHIQRPMYCGKCLATLSMPAGRKRIVSIRPNMYAAVEAEGASEPEVRTLESVTDGTGETLRWVELIRAEGRVKDVAEADVIVAGGRSLKSEENFGILYDLAEALDGGVGASRAAVDEGFQPASRQVGLTGKVVTPRLYLACGIDGAIQHLAGMRGSKVIVAINTKPDAPIYSVATYGCAVDLFTLVPLLTAEVQCLQESG